MKSFAYELDVDSFSDRYSYSSNGLNLPSLGLKLSDLSVLGTVNTETFDDLYWLRQKRGIIDFIAVGDTESQRLGKLSDDGVYCKVFVTQRELADLRAILARLTEEKICLSFMVQGSLQNPENLYVGNLIKDRVDFNFDFSVEDVSRTVSYDNS